MGTCYSGSTMGSGTIFKADLDGSNLQAVHSFAGPEGRMPWGKIAQAPNGNIYGVTFLGGCGDSCTIYEYDPVTGICLDVYDFFCFNPYIGEPSQGGLIILPDGYLYGCQQNGIMYKFNPNTHVYTLLNQTPGVYYMSGLMQASDGALYGVSYQTSTNNYGTIFRYDLSLGTYSVVHDFDGTHGATPRYVSLIQATDSKLYGTTSAGGSNGVGVIFSYDIATSTYTDLYDFNTLDGNTPYNGVIQASNGKLYGVTNVGGANNLGVIYSYDISASQYIVLYDFDGSNNGSNPLGGLTQASNGKLFGTTSAGGAMNYGVAFRYDIASATYTKLIDFNYSTGDSPQGDILEASLPIETGIASANSSRSIYVDAANQLVVNSSVPAGKVQIVMYDALGKNVFEAEIVNQKSEFNLSSFQRGIYFVQMKKDKEIITQKIILSK